jgi:hemin uptake protein HemP
MMTGTLRMTETKPPNINLEDLMRGSKKVILHHGKRPYCLTITRKGNLILTSAEENTNTGAETTTQPAKQSGY